MPPLVTRNSSIVDIETPHHRHRDDTDEIEGNAELCDHKCVRETPAFQFCRCAVRGGLLCMQSRLALGVALGPPCRLHPTAACATVPRVWWTPAGLQAPQPAHTLAPCPGAGCQRRPDLHCVPDGGRGWRHRQPGDPAPGGRGGTGGRRAVHGRRRVHICGVTGTPAGWNFLRVVSDAAASRQATPVSEGQPGNACPKAFGKAAPAPCSHSCHPCLCSVMLSMLTLKRSGWSS